MPDPLREDHVLECVVFGVADGQAILNVFHWQVGVPAGGNVDVSIDDVAVALRSAWRAGVIPSLHQSYVASQYQVTTIDGKTAIPGTFPAQYKLKYGLRGIAAGGTAADTGAKAGDPLPTFCGMGFIKRSNASGRDGRGAIRFAPILETDIDGNNVDLVIGDALRDSAFTNLVEEGEVDAEKVTTVRMVLLRRTRYLTVAAANEPPDGYTYDVKSLQTRPFTSSQTSRKKKSAAGA